MNPAIYSILSVIIVSAISLIGVFSFGQGSLFRKKSLLVIISFAAGAMIGDVFIHILPELGTGGIFDLNISLYILGGIILFYFLEKYIHWHHHHGIGEAGEHATHPAATLNLIGDGIHNLIDGMIIAAAYTMDIRLGIATTIAVLVHEIPQEIGDYGVLIYSGLSKARALMYNLISALISLVGAGVVLIFNQSDALVVMLTSIAAGSFIYISLADLIPETHKEPSESIRQLLGFIFGIVVMALLLLIE